MQTEYRNAIPFPHALLKDIFPSELLQKSSEEIDVALTNIKSELWSIKENEQTRKKFACNVLTEFGSATQELWGLLSNQTFINFLTELTGIQNLLVDHTLKGAGVHAIGKDGYLNVHADFNFHPGLNKYRRVNLLLYLNKNWLPEYGGDLELWDMEMKECVQSYPPLFNHCVIFTSSDYSFHGHPKPLTCPENIYRKSFAAYYYTAEKPEDMSEKPHSTLYQTIK